MTFVLRANPPCADSALYALHQFNDHAGAQCATAPTQGCTQMIAIEPLAALGHVATGRALGALAVVLALAACAAPAPGSAPSQAAAASAAPPAAPREGDRETRMRQLQQAEALYLSGHLKEAQAAFEQLSRTYPRNVEIWFRYGNTLMREGSYDDAASAYQNAVALDPGQGRAALNLALVRLAQAQRELDRARSNLADGSPERQQADALQREVQALLGSSGSGQAAH